MLGRGKEWIPRGITNPITVRMIMMQGGRRGRCGLRHDGTFFLQGLLRRQGGTQTSTRGGMIRGGKTFEA